MREPDPDRWLAALEDDWARDAFEQDDDELEDEDDELDGVNEDGDEER